MQTLAVLFVFVALVGALQAQTFPVNLTDGTPAAMTFSGTCTFYYGRIALSGTLTTPYASYVVAPTAPEITELGIWWRIVFGVNVLGVGCFPNSPLQGYWRTPGGITRLT